MPRREANLFSGEATPSSQSRGADGRPERGQGESRAWARACAGAFISGEFGSIRRFRLIGVRYGVLALALGQCAVVALAGPAVAGERQPGQKRSPAQLRQDRLQAPRPDVKALADRIDRREPGSAGKGVMRFGDTEIRVGGRASFGYGYSGR